MKVKVFYPNREGKIEFTRQELEKLLDEVYREGQKDCNCGKSWTWTTPYFNTNDLTLTNNSTNNIVAGPDLSTATYVAGSTTSAIDDFKAESISAKPFTITMKIPEGDIKKATEELTNLVNKQHGLAARDVVDVFTNLAKELNF